MADRRFGNTLLAYYSRTGTTRTVAEAIAETVPELAIDRIRPASRRSYFSRSENGSMRTSGESSRRSYWNWLARSFVPGSRVAIEPPAHDPADYDTLLLGTPKWTLSCPPVTEYVERSALQGLRVGLFVTYGGFDEQRYARHLTSTLEEQGATVAARLLVQRDRAEDLPTKRLQQFLAAVHGTDE